MDPGGPAASAPEPADRAGFYRRFYGPVAVNSRHGLAVVETGSCVLLFANARFLASHGLPARTPFPCPCPSIRADREHPCGGSGQDRGPDAESCPAVRACAEDGQVVTVESRPRGGGLPARSTEILATPICRNTGPGSGSEVLVIEKEEQQLEHTRGAAEEEREHLAAIIRHSADAIIGLDLDGKIRSWNAGATQTFGYTEAETLGRDHRFLVPDDQEAQDEYDRSLKEFERRGILRNYQARRIGKDGRTVSVTCTHSLVLGPDGNPVAVSVICRDVTMEVLLKELIDHQVRAMAVTHEIGDVLHSTRDVEEILQVILLGVTAGQGLGFNRAFLLLVEEHPGGGGARLKGKMAIGPSNAEEAGVIWSTLSHQRFDLMELYRMYCEKSASMDALVNDIVARIDVPLSDETHVLIRALRSRRALNILRGRSTDSDRPVDAQLCELLGCDTFAVVPLNTRDRAIGVLLVDNRITGVGISDADLQMLKVFANHAGTALENSQLRANLERRLAELAQLNLAMKESQNRLMQAERLSVIGELAARVVHEVRNPLVSIGGFARLVRRGFDQEDPRSDYLRIISDEVARLERIVQHLLDFSHPRTRMELTELNLNDLVREIVAMATVEAEAHGVSVFESYSEELGTVTIDGDRLRQVLLNLIRNALDAMLDSGELRISTEALDGDRFQVTIRDTGPGIPPEQRDSVFDPGFTTRRDGTGFGLAIAKRLVDSQGGQITMRESEPRGCTFDIVIPRQVQMRSEPENGEGAERPANGPAGEDPHPDRR